MERNELDVVLEALESKMDAVLEIVAPLPRRLDDLEVKVDELVDRVGAVETILRLQAEDTRSLRGRLEEHEERLDKHDRQLGSALRRKAA